MSNEKINFTNDDVFARAQALAKAAGTVVVTESLIGKAVKQLEIETAEARMKKQQRTASVFSNDELIKATLAADEKLESRIGKCV